MRIDTKVYNYSMTQFTQAKRNIGLSEELMNYLIATKTRVKSNYSYVVFVRNNTIFNKANSLLVKDLLNEGKKVIKAEKTNNSREPWIFTNANELHIPGV